MSRSRRQDPITTPGRSTGYISQTKPATRTPTPASNLGAPEQHAQRMSPSVAAALDSWFKDAYMNCWSPPPTTPEGETYIAEVQVEFNSDGSLAGQPVLVNPPSDPAWKPHAESAMARGDEVQPDEDSAAIRALFRAMAQQDDPL